MVPLPICSMGKNGENLNVMLESAIITLDISADASCLANNYPNYSKPLKLIVFAQTRLVHEGSA